MNIVIAEFCENDPSTTWVIDINKLQKLKYKSAKIYYKTLEDAAFSGSISIKYKDSLTYGDWSSRSIEVELPAIIDRIVEVYII